MGRAAARAAVAAGLRRAPVLTMSLTAVSIFAGIGGIDLALQRAGVDVTAAVELDKPARGVLARHMPSTLFPDVREVGADDLRDTGFVPERGILAGGFPCQDLSVAGRRSGMGRESGTRSALFWEIDRLLGELHPRWILLENVPGLLSANGGRDMGAVLGSLAQHGYGFAYRVLDAQWFGVPQQRRRVFIVGHLGDARRPAQVLLEPESSSRDSTPSTGPRAGVAALTADGVGTCGPDDNQAQAGHLIATALTAREGKGPDSDATTTLVANTLTSDSMQSASHKGTTVVAHALTSLGHDASEDGTGRGTPLVPTSLAVGQDHSTGENVAQPVTGSHGQPGVVAWQQNRDGDVDTADAAQTLKAEPSSKEQLLAITTVRKLTPRECERLQGFPDDWTRWRLHDGRLVEQSDSARYKQVGNAVAVPCVEWIARRVVEHETGQL